MVAARLSQGFVRLSAVTVLLFPLLALKCSDTSGPNAGDEPPSIGQLPGTYVADMTLRSRTGGAGGCPTTSHRFETVVVHAGPVFGTLAIEFTFPVSGFYVAATGTYTGNGRTDSSITGFEIVLEIEGEFSREGTDGSGVVLVGSSVIRLEAKAPGAEYCRTALDVRMERIGP